MIISAHLAFGQGGGKWSTGGNSLGQGDFLGSTNNAPLLFKVNNNLSMTLQTSGIVNINSLAGKGLRILKADPNGDVTPLLMGTSSQVLLGDGTWGNLPAKTWAPVPGTGNIFYQGGNVGIGNSNPGTTLDVTGDISSTGNISAGKQLILANKIGISYTPPSGNGPAIFSIGPVLPGPPGPPAAFVCGAALTVPVINQFQHLIQLYGNAANGGYQNTMTMGYDGANNIIETEGNNNDGFSPRLLMHYYCGRDIFMCTGANGGNVNICNGPNASSAVYLGKTHVGAQLQATGPHTNAMLTVDGKMVAKSCYITLSDWADYVFEKDYKLPSLAEVESYYKANKHLPEIPSEAEVAQNGVEVGEMNKLLLKKVEELTLYMVQQQKEINELKAKLENKKQ